MNDCLVCYLYNFFYNVLIKAHTYESELDASFGPIYKKQLIFLDSLNN